MDPLHREIGKENQQRDWSELSSDLIGLIARKLIDVFDFVRFRAVCKHWLSAVPVSDHHPLFPCLIGGRGDHVLLYSLPSGERRTIKFPDAQNDINAPKPIKWLLFGATSNSGHIIGVTSGSNNLALINPLTKSKVILPPTRCDQFLLLGVGLDPSGRWEHVAITGLDEHLGISYLALCRRGTYNWVKIKIKRRLFTTMTYYKGMYYCMINDTGVTEAVNAISGVLVSTIPPPKTRNGFCYTKNRYFVESSGELLLVCQNKNFTRWSPLTKYNFEIYQLKQENEYPIWVKVSKITDQALFLGKWNGGFSVTTPNFDQFRSNSIYYIDYSPNTTHLMRYGIEDGCCEELSCVLEDVVDWIMPSLR